jgi:hypothetical protein
MWAGICIGLDCGHIHIEASSDPEREFDLSDFLGVSPTPYVKPWVRQFRRLTSCPELLPLKSSEAPCWSCEEADLVMRIPLSGIERLYDAGLCLFCGAVIVRCMPMDRSGPTNVYGGVDWTTPDEAVVLLRRGIASIETGPPDQDTWPF